MSQRLRTVSLAALLAATAWAQQKLPDGPGRETTERVCGTCHSANIVNGRGLTRPGWSEVVTSMIARGAKGSDAEFTEVVDYLARTFPVKTATPAGATGGGVVTGPRRPPGGGLTLGPDNQHVVDVAAAQRGKSTYAAQCESCHGPKARGTNNGQDLVRSVVVMHDRYGSTLGPFLVAGHPDKSQAPKLTEAQIGDLAHFVHQQLNDTLRSGPYSKVLNVLTGDPKAGEAYFNGAGGCGKCHSITGDLAGVAGKYDASNLQQRFLFPQVVSFTPGASAPHKPVMVTVTPAGGAAVTGQLELIDDFDVSLRDSAGEYHAFKRTPDTKVEKHDPYAGHVELLDRYTDADIHNVVAYLETLK